MRAIILAGGKGTRLMPYTTLIPKPLVPIGGKYSILEIVIQQLSRAGFTHITMAVNHLSHLIMSYFSDGSKWGIKIDYSQEEIPLSTIGPLTLIKDLPENFLVINGDILSDLDYRSFFDEHCRKKSKISVASASREVKIDFGVLKYNQDGNLIEFQEKPSLQYDVSMGIYCISKSVIDELPKGKSYGFDNLMLDGILKGFPIAVEKFSGYWLDIGRTEDYQMANENYEEIFQKLGIDH
jgi:NDP-mannose synthase